MVNFCKIIFIALIGISSIESQAQINLNTADVESVLYLGSNRKQALVVGLGGSEGGNSWTSDYWKNTRDEFIDQGYAFLAIGYFGADNTPDLLDRVSIDAVYKAIKTATAHKRVDKKNIAVVGGSRGADLALLLASYYDDIDCVVSIVGSHTVFPGHTDHFTTSCWSFNGEELPFVPLNDACIPFLMEGDLRGTFEAMLLDTVALEKAAIPIEKINGPILFLSADQDEICPSTPMANYMVDRLGANEFEYFYEHKIVEGGHAAPLGAFDYILKFLEEHFKS